LNTKRTQEWNYYEEELEGTEFEIETYNAILKNFEEQIPLAAQYLS
jgi:hypothetical protein